MRHSIALLVLLSACSPEPSSNNSTPMSEDAGVSDMKGDAAPDMRTMDAEQDAASDLRENDAGQCPNGADFRECDDGDPTTRDDFCRVEGCAGRPCPCLVESLCCDGCRLRNIGAACTADDGTTGLCSDGICYTGG